VLCATILGVVVVVVVVLLCVLHPSLRERGSGKNER